MGDLNLPQRRAGDMVSVGDMTGSRESPASCGMVNMYENDRPMCSHRYM